MLHPFPTLRPETTLSHFILLRFKIYGVISLVRRKCVYTKVIECACMGEYAMNRDPLEKSV